VYGNLATDRTHQLGVQFLYSFNFGLSVGLNQYLGTGTPVQEIATVPINSYFYPKGRGNLGETDTITQTDLTLWQTFNFGRFDLSLGLTVLNLFDEEAVTRVYSQRTFQDLEITDEEFFAGFDYDTLVQEVDPDPAFNMPDTYQQLRRLRLTVKFEF
jgi:outer membrane receptor protein involved in Fe transport